MTYIMKVAIGFDQFVNTLFGGYPDETISAKAYRLSVNEGVKWPMEIINVIFFWQKNHCRGAYYSELERKQLPSEYR